MDNPPDEDAALEQLIEDFQNKEDKANLPKARAAVRLKAGTLAWSENMYQVQVLNRARSASYKARQRARWVEKKEQYNEQRQERRAQARDDKRKLGFIISDKSGRPHNPPAVAAVPLEVNKALNTDQMVFLAKENIFEALRSEIAVPEAYEYTNPETGVVETADLTAYLKTPTIAIEDKPLSWGMFRFMSWRELVANTRYNYVSNARLALKDAGYMGLENDAKIKEHLVYLSERDATYHKDDDVEDVPAGEQEVFEDADLEEGDEVKAAPKAKKPPAKKSMKRVIFTQNPIAVVQYMLAVNMDPWKVIALTYETNQNNSRASGLASVCYTYLRMLYEKEEYQSDNFNVCLEWSEIFRKYTSIARQHTGEKHSQQLATAEDVANTVPWDLWRAKALAFIKYYLNVDGNTVTVRETINPKRHGYTWNNGPRPRYRTKKDAEGNTVLNAAGKAETELIAQTPPPWLNKSFTGDAAPRRPNLRELRDVAIVAVYSLIAPIRLDWAKVEIKDKKPAQKTDNTSNTVVVNDLKKPTELDTAFFGQFKNRKKFFQNALGFPVPKFVRDESPLCANILLVYLQERLRQGFKSKCLFPYSTTTSNTLQADVCFTNEAFGGRLSDLGWDITGKEFRETLIRRSYLTWFWEQPNNDPLDNGTWDRLLPTVHQTSSKISLGYIKKVNDELQQWRKDHPGHTPMQERDFLAGLRDQARNALVVNAAAQESDAQLDIDVGPGAPKELEPAKEPEDEPEPKAKGQPQLKAKAAKEVKAKPPPKPKPAPKPNAKAKPPPKAKQPMKAKPAPKAKAVAKQPEPEPEPTGKTTRSGRSIKRKFF